MRLSPWKRAEAFDWHDSPLDLSQRYTRWHTLEVAPETCVLCKHWRNERHSSPPDFDTSVFSFKTFSDRNLRSFYIEQFSMYLEFCLSHREQRLDLDVCFKIKILLYLQKSSVFPRMIWRPSNLIAQVKTVTNNLQNMNKKLWLRRPCSSSDLFVEHFVVRHNVFLPCPTGFKLSSIAKRRLDSILWKKSVTKRKIYPRSQTLWSSEVVKWSNSPTD